MKEVVRIEQAAPESDMRGPRRRVSIALRGAIATALASLPLIVAGALSLFIAVSSSPVAATLSGVLGARVALFGTGIPEWLIPMLLVLALCAWATYLSIDFYFTRPIRLIHAWVKLANELQFEHFGALPDLGNDEMGDIGRGLLAAGALIAKTRSDNKLHLQEKSLFITIAAHQLRTPLTGLLWSIDALLNPSTPEDQKPAIMTDVESLLKRMRLIVNHILASANVEGGKYGYVFEQVDIVPIIAKLIEEFKPVSDAHHVEVKFEHPDIGASVYADSERISLAIFDLLSNAIDYTPSGGTVTVSVTQNAGGYEIAIADTGIGISETELPNLFSKFYRSDRARHVRPDGSGLGLYLVKEIISSHGSTIAVTSKEGKGSRFSFLLRTGKA